MLDNINPSNIPGKLIVLIVLVDPTNDKKYVPLTSSQPNFDAFLITKKIANPTYLHTN